MANIDSFLSELECEEIAKFNKNTIMREAVRKVLLSAIYENGTLREGMPADPLRNVAFSLAASRGDFSNERLGQDLRAVWEGVNLLESGMGQLLSYKVDVPQKLKEKVNPAV
jgi:hypothetical protein